MSFARPVTYVPGPVTAVVADGVALLIDADPTGPVVTSCRAALLAAGVDALLGVLSDPVAPVPSFALAVADGDGLRMLVSGRARAEFAGGAAPTLDAPAGQRRLDQRIDPAPDARLILVDPAAPADPSWPQLPIDAGVVLAAALFVPGTRARPVDPNSDTGDIAGDIPGEISGDAAGRSAADVVAPPPAAGPTVFAPLPATYPQEWLAPPADLPPAYVAPVPGEPSSGGDGAPMVQAVICANSHLNAPFVVGACRVCGAPVPAQAPFLAPRPVLGVLVLGSGDTVPVDRDVLLGRAPSAVDQGSARVVILPSPNNDLSRTHVRVAADGWLVQVTDLGSTNGTVATMPGQQAVRLRAHDPFVLVPGTVINLADEALVRFEVPS